jgi:hypothetical protein
MALQTTPISKQWLSRSHVGNPTGKEATFALQQRNLFCFVLSVLYNG